MRFGRAVPAALPIGVRACLERDVWADTICIHKTSSVELSVCINSMYAYYRKAAICYVYLFDVCIGKNHASTSTLATITEIDEFVLGSGNLDIKPPKKASMTGSRSNDRGTFFICR
jgi:hypothetical protein